MLHPKDSLIEFPYASVIEGTDKITSDYLVEQFKSMILTERLPAGYLLPNETTICEQLGIGRSTLREAFKVLKTYGLINRTTHGTFINDSKDFSSAVIVDYSFEESSPKEILEFRQIFETEAAYLAARNATADDIKELKKILLQMEKHTGDSLATSYDDMRFHYQVACCTHNRLIISIMNLISSTYFKSIKYHFSSIESLNGRNPYEFAFHYHTKIFDSILLKDSAAAAEYMKEHIDITIASLKD